VLDGCNIHTLMFISYMKGTDKQEEALKAVAGNVCCEALLYDGSLQNV